MPAPNRRLLLRFLALASALALPVLSARSAPPSLHKPLKSPPKATRLAPERAEIASQARLLCERLHSGQVTLTVPSREGEQLERLANAGVYLWPPPPLTTNNDLWIDTFLRDDWLLRADSTLPSRAALPGLRSGLLLPPESLPFLDPKSAVPVPTQPSPALLRMLTTLAAHATPRHPLELLTLLRPPYRSPAHPHGSPTNVHSLGMATDIAAYGGHRIRLDQPEACVAMTLALLRDLPPGIYRLGVPKAPELPALVGWPRLTPALLTWLTTSAACPSPALAFSLMARSLTLAACGLLPAPHWPFFPQQEFETVEGLVAPLIRDGQIVRDASGVPVPHLVRFANEDYAPLESLGDSRVRAAILAAQARGVDIYALFPDAADHVHIDVRPKRR